MNGDSVLDLAKKYESGGQNILNYLYDPQHTAGGYWQITDTNWRAYAPKVGIDINKYPTAISMKDEGQQRKVADYILNNTPKGVRNWTDYNPKLKAALDTMMPQQVSYDNMSLEDLQKLSAQLHQQYDQLSKSVSTSKQAKVDAPKSSLERYAASGFGLIPAAKDVGKAFSDPDWRDKISDVIEGGGEAAPVLGGIGAATTLATEGLAAIPELAMRYGVGYAGSEAAQFIADQAGGYYKLDPKTRRLVDDLAGLGGGYAGYKGGPSLVKGTAKTAYNVGTNPTVGRFAGAGAAHTVGLPGWMGYLAGKDLLPKAVRGLTPEFMKKWMGVDQYAGGPSNTAPAGNVSPPPASTSSSTAAPKSTVNPPGIKVNMAEVNLMHENGVINDDRYVAIRNGATPTNDEIIANRKIEIAKKNAKNQPPKPQSPIQIAPKPPQAAAQPNPPIPMPGGGAVTPPSPVQAVPTAPVQPPPNPSGVPNFARTPIGRMMPAGQNQMPGMQIPAGQGAPLANLPVQPPPPPMPPGQQTMQFGPTQTELPLRSMTPGSQPMAAQQSLDLEVKPPGFKAPEQTEIKFPEPEEDEQQRVDLMSPEESSRRAGEVARALRSRPDLRPFKSRYNTAESAERFSKRLGLKFVAKPRDFENALDLINKQKRSERPTASYPNKD